eukprot:TRINITY_DN35404_c0_g1_i1.p1 TRINITY_DN35404_c0_g1~~TRINITY_DN35404_c0_g1_i1.p1  ORF type:complete len:580 (+),score=79.22 TRINITY_DN35404_c0_g1_i1:80-1819(+)
MAPKRTVFRAGRLAKGNLLFGRLVSRGLFCVGILALFQNMILLHLRSTILNSCTMSRPTLGGMYATDPSQASLGIAIAQGGMASMTARNDVAGSPVIRRLGVATPDASSVTASGAAQRPQAGHRMQLNHLSSLSSVPREELRLFGKDRPELFDFCIGFGSVKRKKEYIFTTIAEMLGLDGKETLDSGERKRLVIVTHLADFDTEWVAATSLRLQRDYKDLVDTGVFHGIHAPEERYPPLDICPPTCTYKDDPKRVRWRSKQNVDYAFLMQYAAPLATYYLQMEDDISFAPHWVNKMSDYVKSAFPPGFVTTENVPWRMIDFSELGFIGKLFQSNELPRMARYLLLYYDQMPCDLLLPVWSTTMGQAKRFEYFRRSPALFQHIGVFRTLGGFQILQETNFGNVLFDNPSASLFTNFTIRPTFAEHFAYRIGPQNTKKKPNDVCAMNPAPKGPKQVKRCWFWAADVKAGQHLTITFRERINVKGVFAQFSLDKHPDDKLLNGEVQVADQRESPEGAPTLGDAACGEFFTVQKIKADNMIYWEQGVSTPAAYPMTKVKCLRIIAIQSQDKWMAIWSVMVRTS